MVAFHWYEIKENQSPKQPDDYIVLAMEYILLRIPRH